MNKTKTTNTWQVVKVDGNREAYDEAKVIDAIFLAAQDVGGTDEKLAKSLGRGVTEYLAEQFGRAKEISTRDIGDAVERLLMVNHHIRTAKAYILNRDRKREEYENKIRLGVHDDVGLSLNALVVMKNKYLQHHNPHPRSPLRSPSGEDSSEDHICETPKEAFERVAKALSEAEKTDKAKKVWQDKFFKVMIERRFLPGGRTLANAGTVNNQLANCFVMPFPDDIEGIFEIVKESSILKKNGGGVGFSFSKVRPKGDLIKTTSGRAAGPVALMGILDHASQIFVQAGGRRSGNMVTLSVTHPDIFEFIGCKESGSNLPNINYSLEVSSAFMKAVEEDDDWDLINPHTGRVTETVSARSILEQAARMAWKRGDPGIIFIDEINKYNPTPHIGRLETVNLCGEQPLLPYEACNLGSINLAAMVKPTKGKQSSAGDYVVDWSRLKETVEIGVRMLDNVISIGTYPLEALDKTVKNNRKIGLGVMGFADMLIKLGLNYDSLEARKMAEKVMRLIQQTAWKTSETLGKEKGNFPNFKGSIWEQRGYKHFRNATTTTIAPTGSLSTIADCSGGIEPIFALAYWRKAMGEYELPEVNRDLVTTLKRLNGIYSSELMSHIARQGSVLNMMEIPESVRKTFVTAMDISPEGHVLMQAAFQKYVDNAVSKTVNLPANSSIDEVIETFILAWKQKCKGITVYRDKSRSEQVLNIGKSTTDSGFKIQDSRKKPTNQEKCPECGGKLVKEEGCANCKDCGYSACSV